MTTLLVNPSRETLKAERVRLGLHPLMVDDLLGPQRHPKFEQLPNYFWLSVWDLNRGADPSGIDSDITLIFNREELLVVQRGPAGQLRDLAAVLARSTHARSSSPIADVYRVLEAVVSDFVALGAEFESDLDEVEDEVFDTGAREDYARIYRLRRRIGRIDRAASGMAEVLRAADADIHTATADEHELRPYFQHLRDDATGVAELAAAEHTALDAVVSSHESNVSTRQNKDMRTISAFAALLALPTVIASFYGMNFPNLPLLDWEYGWVAVTGAMVAVDVIAWVLFRRRGWIGRTKDEEGNSQEA